MSWRDGPSLREGAEHVFFECSERVRAGDMLDGEGFKAFKEGMWNQRLLYSRFPSCAEAEFKFISAGVLKDGGIKREDLSVRLQIVCKTGEGALTHFTPASPGQSGQRFLGSASSRVPVFGYVTN